MKRSEDGQQFNTALKLKWMILSGITILSIVSALTYPGRSMNRYVNDLMYFVRGEGEFCRDVVIVAIDEPSFAVIKQQWPWGRDLHAELVESLYQSGARAVGLNLLFSEPSDPVQDEIFRDVLKRYPQTVLASAFDTVERSAFKQQALVGPHPCVTTATTHTGFINLPIHEDGVIRRTFLRAGRENSFALEICKRVTRENQNSLMNVDAIWLNYAGPPGTFEAVSYYQAMQPSHLPPAFFENRIVLVGFMTLNSDLSVNRPDHFPVPWSGWGKGYMSGIELHANAVSNIITGNNLTLVPTFLSLTAGLAVTLCLAVFLTTNRHRLLLPTWLAAIIIAPVTGLVLFSFCHSFLKLADILIPMTAVCITCFSIRFYEVAKQRLFVRKAFSTYVSEQVVKELMKNPNALTLGGEDRNITAFFSDIQGFTSLSEKMSPRELVAFLNEYLSEMSDIILANEGTVDKFEGDAIIAFFGAPQTQADHADRAVESTLKMYGRLGELNNRWREKRRPEVKMRTGLCSGPAVVGNMGTDKRMDYTMMGDTVNVAARLEGANKIYGTYSMISETTFRELKGDVITRELDRIKVIGRRDPVTIYQLVGFFDDRSGKMSKVLRLYASGLAYYRAEEFTLAEECFHKALLADPMDGPSKIMLARCRDYRKTAPPEGWDAVFRQTIK